MVITLSIIQISLAIAIVAIGALARQNSVLRKRLREANGLAHVLELAQTSISFDKRLRSVPTQDLSDLVPWLVQELTDQPNHVVVRIEGHTLLRAGAPPELMKFSCMEVAGVTIYLRKEPTWEVETKLGILAASVGWVYNSNNRDALTGLPMRACFEDLVAVESIRSKRPKGSPFSILFIDMDKFKEVNDTYGHLAGDEVLQKFAQVLKSHLREYDIAARVGGDEFAVLLQRTSRSDAQKAARALRFRAKSIPFSFDADYRLSISVGVATYGEDGEEINGLLARADEGMYKAKRRHHNR